MLSMGLTQAREMIGEIRKAAAAFIECVDAYDHDPSSPVVMEYIDAIDDRITRYMRALCGAGSAMTTGEDDPV